MSGIARSWLCWRPWSIALACAMLAGCGHDIRQLNSMKENARVGNHAANAAIEVTCTEGEPCAQLRLIKGDACYHQASESSRLNTSVDMVKRYDFYNCAITNFDRAFKLNPPETGPLGDLCTYRLKRMDALNQRSELKSKDAEYYKASCPEDEENYYYYSATAIIADIQKNSGQPQFCSKWKQADELVHKGQVLHPAKFKMRENDIKQLKTEGHCT